MKKALKTFSLIVIALFTLSIFGWMSQHISKGDRKFGFLTEPVKFMYSFPDLFSQSVEEVQTMPPTFLKTPDNFSPVNNLKEDFFVLSTYTDTNDSRSIVILNLKNDSVYYKWTVLNSYENYDRIINPIIFPNKNLIYSFTGKGLRRIDSLGNVIWKQDSIEAHHSLTLDSNGDIWVCSFEPVYYATAYYKLDGRTVFFKDNYITKIDPKTGYILYHKSVTSILNSNNLSNYLLKSNNVKDPIHINDIQPALKTTKYYKEGDLFISARCPSIILHYRPSTNKVVNVIEGAFVCQHDVDFLNDNSLVIFNNNYYAVWSNESYPPPSDSSKLTLAGDLYSNIVKYDFASDSISFIGDSIFRANNISSFTEGLVEFVNPTTYFVEEQNTGLIWIIEDNKVLYKNVLKSQHKGYHHLPNWIRILEYND